MFSRMIFITDAPPGRPDPEGTRRAWRKPSFTGKVQGKKMKTSPEPKNSIYIIEWGDDIALFTMRS